MPAASKRIVIVGAGPKAMAIVGKAWALREAGCELPEITIVDQLGCVAGNWSGEHGYTDGGQPLGTPPEKDVGFPYTSDCWDSCCDEINAFMLRLSWQAYLASGASGRLIPYADWVDRGKPHPTHAEWGRYLRWVYGQAEASFAGQVEPLLVDARLESIDVASDPERWKLVVRNEDGSSREIECDGVVLTGPGAAKTLCGDQPISDRLFDGRSYWQHIDIFDGFTRDEPRNVCVVGTGETAASVVVSLLSTVPSTTAIDIVSSKGVVYSRGESYDENRLYTDPGLWLSMAKKHRTEFIQRTDRSVFSVHAKEITNSAPNLSTTILGHVDAVEEVGDELELTINYQNDDAPDTTSKKRYDYVIAAAGFDALSFWSMLSPEARARVEGSVKTKYESTSDTLILNVVDDLGVGQGFPRLHVPMLAAQEQGPGFPNLSSLGRLSDRILKPYVTLPPPPGDEAPLVVEVTA